MAGPTNFAESNALLAVMEGDEAEARRILGDLFPGELHHLAEAAERLASLCGESGLVRDHADGKHAGMVNGSGIDSRALNCPRCQDEAGWAARRARDSELDAALAREAK